MAVYEKKGKFDCHAGLAFLDAIIPGFLDLHSDLRKTGKKIKATGDIRGERMLRVARRISRMRTALGNFRVVFNRGF